MPRADGSWLTPEGQLPAQDTAVTTPKGPADRVRDLCWETVGKQLPRTGSEDS